MKRLPASLAAALLLSAATATAFAAEVTVAGTNGPHGTTTVNVVVDDVVKAAMNLCEYNYALTSPGGIVAMPVHIRGVTDDRNRARCVEGRWLPASIIHAPGDAVAPE
ncbi:hypothetical protein [Azospirillum canadense]|uniref:hypothetical protein n=1 Tax=Azospirillum canadense TaxID=403962 RepID=UPI0022277826|nr:hypothetical protein [Azospirillum canadense]MCW2240771.1 hypothetical protein [Azospirillum canadense]